MLWKSFGVLSSAYARCAGGGEGSCVPASALDKGERVVDGDEVFCGSVGLIREVKKSSIVLYCFGDCAKGP